MNVKRWALATVGAFRVVPGHDLRDRDDRSLDPRNSELRHLREQGLVDAVRMDGRRDVAVFLTDRGHSLLEAHRRERDHDPRDDPRDDDRRQEFYAGLVKPRELEHDAHAFKAYLHEVERLLERLRNYFEQRRTGLTANAPACSADFDRVRRAFRGERSRCSTVAG